MNNQKDNSVLFLDLLRELKDIFDEHDIEPTSLMKLFVKNILGGDNQTYYVDDYEVNKDRFEELLREAIEVDVDSNLEDLINEEYGEIEIGGWTFYAYDILKEMASDYTLDDIKETRVNDDFEEAIESIERGNRYWTNDTKFEKSSFVWPELLD